jgi:hypothetical protein
MRRKGAQKLTHLLARERDGIVRKYIKFLISSLISEYILCLSYMQASLFIRRRDYRIVVIRSSGPEIWRKLNFVDQHHSSNELRNGSHRRPQ